MEMGEQMQPLRARKPEGDIRRLSPIKEMVIKKTAFDGAGCAWRTGRKSYLRNADTVMRSVKDTGRNSYAFTPVQRGPKSHPG
jgi:hypothetical protein